MVWWPRLPAERSIVMKPDDPDVLLAKARADLKVLTLFHSKEMGTDEQFGFACQQAVEKAMKSVLRRHGIDYPWTHDLTRLLLLLDQSGIAFPAALRESDLYTPFAVRFRYEDLPEADASAAPFDRSHALGVASLAVGWAVGFSKV